MVLSEVESQLLEQYLGWYPRMLVTGSPVTDEQAREIIRRTDRFFDSFESNDYAYVQEAARLLNILSSEPYNFAFPNHIFSSESRRSPLEVNLGQFAAEWP